MIYEMRTYDLKPHSVPEVEQRFAEAYEIRKKHSLLSAFWHTEIGPLNQIIHIWQYDNLQHRADTRAAAAKDPSGLWPPKGAVDLAWCETQYRMGLLARKSQEKMFQALTALRGRCVIEERS